MMVVTMSKVCLKFRRNDHRTLVGLHNVLGFRKAFKQMIPQNQNLLKIFSALK